MKNKMLAVVTADHIAVREVANPASSYGPAVPQNQAESNLIRLTGHVARRRAGPVETVLWDQELTGFGLRIQPSGHKAWVVKYVERGRQKKVTLGSVHDLDATTARGRARALLAKVATNGLPRPTPCKEAPTFADHAGIFWADYSRHWKPATQAANRRMIWRELVPVFGSTSVDRITKAHVMRWRDDLSARPGVFNRAVPVMSVMLSYAEQLGHRKRGSNPCRGTPRYRRTLMERYLSAAEYRRLSVVLLDYETEAPDVAAVIRLLLYTGARLSEILTLQWDLVQPPHLHLPDSKTGPKIVYLNLQAAAVLTGIAAVEGCPWVFPNRLRDGPLRTIMPQWQTLRRAAAIPDVRIHDLRHSFASTAINGGVSLILIGRLLGHALPETTARYAHLEDRSVSEAAVRVSGSLARALGMSA